MHQIRRFSLTGLLIVLLTACAPTPPTPTATLEATASAEPTSILPTASPTRAATPTPRQNPGQVRVVNAVVDSPPLNLFIDRQAIATNLGFGSFTEPTTIPAQPYTVRVVPSGGRADTPALLETTLTVEGNQAAMWILKGTGTDLSLFAIPAAINPLNAAESLAVVVNATTDAPAVRLRDSSGDLTADIGSERIGLTPTLTAGEKTLQFQVGSTALDLTITLRERQQYTFIVAGSAASPSIIQYAVSAPGRTAVRAIHASVEFNALDVYLNDTLLNGNIEFGRPTTRMSFASGSYTLRIYAAGEDRTVVQPLRQQEVQLSTENQALIIVGSADDLDIVSYAEDLSPTPLDEARMTFINVVPGIARVNIFTTQGPFDADPVVDLGEVPAPFRIVAGSYSLLMSGMDASRNTVTVESASDIQLEAGIAYLYLISGRLDNRPVIISDRVGTDATLVSNDPNAPPSRNRPALLRFINALTGSQSIDFAIDSTAVVSGLVVSQGSSLIEIAAGARTLSVLSAGTPLVSEDVQLESGTAYTAITYSSAPVRLLLLSDADLIFDGQSPHLRVINLLPDEEQSVGLAYGIASTNAPTLDPAAAGTPSSGALSAPVDSQRLVNDIGAGSASGTILLSQGIYDLYIVNPINNTVLTQIDGLTLESDSHYDIVVYDAGSNSIASVLLVYPDA